MNALQAIGDQKSAPIYVHTSKHLKSNIVPGDLDIPNLTNIHQIWPHIVTASDGKSKGQNHNYRFLGCYFYNYNFF